MRVSVTGPIISLVLTLCPPLVANEIGRADFQQRFAQLEITPPPTAAAVPAQTQLAVPPPSQLPSQSPAPQPPPVQPLPLPPTTHTPVVATPIAFEQPPYEVAPPDVVFRESPYRNSSWIVDFDLIPTAAQFTESEFGSWTDDGSLALRLNLGYENFTGDGMRVRLWTFGQEQATPATTVDLGASTVYWDLYRRLYVEDAELVIGGGAAGANAEFSFPDIDAHAHLNSGGGSIFGEAYFPFAHYEKTDIATVFRARLAVLRGEWRDSGTPFVPDTNHDSITITDIAWGLELRRRFGLHEDKYWAIRFLPEYQRWDSAWLGEFADSNLAFVGASISFGLAW